MIPLRETETGVIFRIRVVPRASRREPVGIQDGALKLRITAPPWRERQTGSASEWLRNFSA